MKKHISIPIIGSIFFLFQSTILPFTTIAQNSQISNSKIVWKGYKVTGSHEGTLDLKSGYLKFDGKKLKGGEFVIDMTTVSTTDMQGEYAENLDSHLKSDDFFGVEKYPTSKLRITKVKNTGKNS